MAERIQDDDVIAKSIKKNREWTEIYMIQSFN